MRYQTIPLVVLIILMCFTSTPFAHYSGTYDIGGSSPDFPNIVTAANSITSQGISGPVICNIWSTTMYEGQVNLRNIPGMSAVNTLTFRNATGQTPVVRAPYFNEYVFKIDSADYITIQGLEIRDCEEFGVYIVGSATDSCKHIRIIGNYIHNIGTWAFTDKSAIHLWYTADCEILGNRIDGDAAGISVYYSKRNLLANNMVYSCEEGFNPGVNPGCIASYQADNQLIYHNSCQSSYVPILYMSDCDNMAIRNNILYQAGSGTYYAIFLWSSPAICDYNDLYAPNGYVVHFEADYQTLAQWQAATAFDDHSISANPNYASSTNLHVNESSPVGMAGIAVPEVTTDFDGQTRKTPNPDIGADEFIFRLAGSYDVGGGANNYATPIAAANQAVLVGISAAVTFNIYSGTYNGQVNLPAIIGSSSTNRIIFQAASGQSPIITNTTGTTQTDGNGFYLSGADYITIQNLQITNTAASGIMNSFTGSDSSSYNYFINNYIHDVGTLGDFAAIYLLNSPNCKVLRNKIKSDYYGIHLNTSRRDTVANNMVYFAGLTGIYENGGTDNRYFYNSVYQEMSPTTTYNFYIFHGTNITLKDNIAYHSGGGTHYAISITGDLGTYPRASDYNDFYAPSAYVGYYNGNRTTLANWQSATGGDAHSQSVDPGFINLATPDLHINPLSPMDWIGTPISGITTDYDGDSRPAVHPDIGADEIAVPRLVGVYDVGGGNNDFPNPASAANYVDLFGILGPVVFNIYSGTYSGQVSISGNIVGSSPTNTVTFQNAPLQSPVITSTNRGIYLYQTDYVTIQGLEIMNCDQDGIVISGTSSDSVKAICIIDNYIYNFGAGAPNYSGIFLSYPSGCQILGNEINANSPGALNGIFISRGTRNLIANNMIYRSPYNGINSEYCSNDSYIYNSLFMAQGTVLKLTAAYQVSVKDNILYQAGSGGTRMGIAIMSNLSSYPVFSDYNDIYAPGALVGFYGGYYPTLSAWQSATSLDLHSISANPNFVNTASFRHDLHVISPTPVDSAGTPLAQITTDFDGDTRNAMTPDIGADEIGAAGPPEAVDDLVITLSCNTRDITDITLTWSLVSGAAQYHIYKSTTGLESGFVLIGSTSGTTYIDSNALQTGVISFYYVTTDNEP